MPSIFFDPYTWLALSSMTLGAALAAATRSTSRARDRAAARTRKWVAFCLLLSAALLLALGALYYAGPQGLLEPGPLYFFMGGSGLFFLVFRFRSTAGAAFVFVLLVAGVASFLFFQSLRAYTGETEIARVRALSVTGQGMTLDLLPRDADPVVVRLDGGYFAPVVRVVVFHDAFVFLGAKTWYRFDGLVSFSLQREEGKPVVRQEKSVYLLPRPPGISERMYGWLEKNDGKVPGIKTVQIDVNLKRPRELETYSVRVQNDGGVEVVPLQ